MKLMENFPYYVNTEKNNTMEVKQKALINISLKMTLYSIKSEL